MNKEAIIKHEGNCWNLYTSDGRRPIGRHETLEDAKRQEQAIHASQSIHPKTAGLFGFGKKKEEPKEPDISEAEYVDRAFKNWNHKADNMRYFSEPKVSDKRIKDYLKGRHQMITSYKAKGFILDHDRLNPKTAFDQSFIKTALDNGLNLFEAYKLLKLSNDLRPMPMQYLQPKQIPAPVIPTPMPGWETNSDTRTINIPTNAPIARAIGNVRVPDLGMKTPGSITGIRG